ncbi:MAG: flagellar filament capping protein FliD [Phycisphaerae bacterium]|nr:flagellar filament capping protein FliD [Phycisphaerae bacterium]
MSGISSSVGLFSGIDTSGIISQLLQIEARPKTQSQQRIVQIQTLQTAILDVNTRLSALKTAASRFNLQRTFEAARAASSNADVLSANAAPGASPGSYSFVVDRLVTTQQRLSRGFADSATTGIGATSISVEPAAARLDSDTALSVLNGGNGITRGRVLVTDSTGTATTVDLTRVASVGDVVRAFNDALGLRGALSVDGDRLVLTDSAGGVQTLSVRDAAGSTGTAASLGLNVAATGPGSGEAVFGTQINRLGTGTTLRTLNDGLGVAISNTAGTAATPDFVIATRDGTSIQVDIGDIYDGQGVRTSTAVSTLGGVIERINSQSNGKVTASIDSSGTRLQLVDNTAGGGTFQVTEYTSGSTTGTTAADLGIKTSASGGGGTITGQRVIAKINSTLTRTVRGGQGLPSGQFEVTARDGTNLNFSVTTDGSINDIISEVSTLSGGKLSLELSSSGRGFVLRDLTGGSGPLTVDGVGALALGLQVDAAATSTVTGNSAQRKYIGSATLLSTLNGGRGVGTGTVELTDSYGVKRNITIGASVTTVGDLLAAFNSSSGSPNVRARINDNGDGLLLEEVAQSGGPGAREISVRDASGGVARALNLAGTATGTGSSNRIDGTYDRTVTLAATDTLQQVADKINQAGVGLLAGVIADGSSGAPFRLSLTSRNSGELGRLALETPGLDLGLTTLAEGTNARIFYGSSDPAQAILLSSSTNSFSGLVPGLTVDARAASGTPVTVTVSADTEAIEQSVQDFVKAYNDVATRITSLSKYDSTTNKRGALLGESTTQLVRGDLVTTILSAGVGLTGRYRTLTQVGLGFDRDGALTLDVEKLRNAISDDPQGVRDLFAARAQSETSTRQEVDGVSGVFVTVSNPGAYTQLGVAEKLALAIDKYIKPIDGLLTRRNGTLDEQIRFQNTRIKQLDSKLASRRTTLERQFLSMEQSIGRLQGQQRSLGSLSALVR